MSLSSKIFLVMLLTSLVSSAPTLIAVGHPILSTKVIVNAKICQNLDILAPGVAVLEAACAKANLRVHAQVRQRALLTKLAAEAHVDTFFRIMDRCNTLAVPLITTISDVSSLSTALSVNLVLPALAQLSSALDVTIATIENVKISLDSKVQATVYQSFVTFATTQQKLFATISANGSLAVQLRTKVAIHVALVHLQHSLQAYVNYLFNYISVDLDHLNVRAALFASLQQAIDVSA